MIKKLIIFLFIFFFLSLFAPKSFAIPIFERIIQPGLLFASPTPAPSPTPTATPTPTTTTAPTETPTLVPATTTPTETTIISPSISPTTVLTASPTPTTTPKQLSQKEKTLVGVGGLLILAILFQNWAKIKTFLHEKTKP